MQTDNCQTKAIPTSTKPHQTFSYSNNATSPSEQAHNSMKVFNENQNEMNQLHGGSTKLNVVQFDTVNPAGPQGPSQNSQVSNQNLVNQQMGSHYDNYAFCNDGQRYNPPGTPGISGGKKIKKSKKNKKRKSRKHKSRKHKSRKHKSRKHKSRKVRRF